MENPDKTTNPAYYEKENMSEKECQGLDDVIAYAINSSKTQQTVQEEEIVERFVSGVNCHPATARMEMMAVKKRFGKEDGTVAYHGYQSFAPGEATPEIAHRIGVELAQRLWGDRYQVVVATHLDKENHLHNHFVLNTVSFADGIKFHRTEQDYHKMRSMSDGLCREYGLSVIQNPQPGKSKQYGEWKAEQEERPTWRGLIRGDIDEVIRQSMTERQFFENLHKKGYEVHVGKDISVRPPGKPRFVRLARNFGEDYTLEGIRRRILEQSDRHGPCRSLPQKPNDTVCPGTGKAVKRSPASGHCICTTAIFWGCSPRTNNRIKDGSTFFSGKISLSWMPSHRKQGCWVRITLILPSSFLHIKRTWKQGSMLLPRSASSFTGNSGLWL